MQRKIPLQTNHVYHICNRGVDKRNVFLDKNDYIRFLTAMNEFNRIEPVGSLHELNKMKVLNSFASCLTP